MLMTQYEKQAAVTTAAIRLESIETWTHRTFVASVVTAAAAVIVALVALYGGYEYVRVKWAISSAQATLAKNVDQSLDKMNRRSGRMP